MTEGRNKPVIVVGAGGHGKVVVDALLAAGRVVLGLTDQESARHGSSVLGCTVLGGDEAILARSPDEVELANGVGFLGKGSLRRDLFQRFRGAGYGFARVIHPSAVVGKDVLIGEGAQVMAGVIVQPGTTIGENAILNTGCRVDHDCRVGAHTHVAPGAVMSGGASVGEHSFVGAGAVLIQGIAVGSQALIGAGSAVIEAIADGTTAVGVPARPLPSSLGAAR